MNCRLCLKPVSLRKSHVIPEFLYTRLYGRRHQALSLNPALPYIRRIRKGLSEYLLCDACETLVNQYEDYFASRWYGTNPLPAELPRGENLIRIVGLDYTRFKLFHLSILWRASVSRLPDFAAVSLGSHEERIRQLLLSGAPGPPGTYPILATLILRPGTSVPHHGLVCVYGRFRHDGRFVYTLVYAACVWHVVVMRSARSTFNGSLTDSGSMEMGVVDAKSVPSLLALLLRRQKLLREIVGPVGPILPPNGAI